MDQVDPRIVLKLRPDLVEDLPVDLDHVDRLDVGFDLKSSHPTPKSQPGHQDSAPRLEPDRRLHCVGASLALEEHAGVHGSRSVMIYPSCVFDSVWLSAVAFATLARRPDMDVRSGARPHALIARFQRSCASAASMVRSIAPWSPPERGSSAFVRRYSIP